MEQQSLNTSLVRTASNLNTVIDRETSKVEWEELDTTRAHCVRDELKLWGGKAQSCPLLGATKSSTFQHRLFTAQINRAVTFP